MNAIEMKPKLYIEIFDNGGKWEDSPIIEIGDKSRFYFSTPIDGMYGIQLESGLKNKEEEIKSICFEIEKQVRALNKILNENENQRNPQYKMA